MKASSLTFDTLALATERPEPIPLPRSGGIPLNPLLFSNDWSSEVSLVTRWSTDITRSIDRTPEKLALYSRPSRSLKVRVVGMGREETHAIVQSALAFTGFLGSPVPLYCDQAVIDRYQSNILFGDFRFRRFFVGGRVAIFPSLVNPSRSANSVIFAVIEEITPNEMTVTFDASTTRQPTPGVDVVCPCIDVELVPSTSGNSQKDDSFEVSFSWDELDGACALPALWPPTTDDSGEILSPICQIVDNLPVFPFDPNWADGVNIELSREIDSDASGRSTIQEPKGVSFYRFGFKLLGYDRQRSWSILRWFDSMQGRAGTFYFLHPQRPWTLLSFPTLNKVRISPCGDARHLQTYHRRVAFIRSDGTMTIRTISSVDDISTAFEITLSNDLPDSNFAAVVPVFICEFEEDSVTETWITDGVCSIEFSIVETPTYSSVNGPSGISYQQQDHSFLKVPGCNLLLRAGAGCSIDGVRTSFPWPYNPWLMNFWDDTSPGPERTLAPQRLARRMSRLDIPGQSIPTLIFFPQQYQNNRQPAILSPKFSYLDQVSSDLPPNQKHLWGPDGWTLFLCFTPQELAPVPVLKTLFHIEGSDGAFWQFTVDRPGTPDRCCLRRGLPGGGPITAVPVTVDISILPYTVYITIRLDRRPGIPDHLRIWANGSQAVSSVVSFPLPNITNYVKSEWFSGFSTSAAVNAVNVAQAFGKWGCANLVASYNRPLDIEEINQIHSVISDIYRTTQEISSI